MNRVKTVAIMVVTIAVALTGFAQAAFVTIGNVGNTNDVTGYGGVAYEYKISDQEVTIAEFATSGAGDGDEGYWNDGTRTVGTGAPAVYVSLYEAMKYCNWLTTGDINNGYYSTVDGGATYQANALAHDAYAVAYGTTYFVSTEDEWYKAAYYDASGTNGYSLYADGTSDIYNPPTTGGGATGWNYSNVNASPNYTRGTALGSTEQNETVNMMGNVWERMEEATGVMRGADCFEDYDNKLRSSYRATYAPTGEHNRIGFRPVVVITDPSEFVTIGNVGNTNDTTGYGGVAYEYKISNQEVTIAEFAASGAGDGDEDYWNDGTRTVGPNAPAGNVTLYEAMKYCNWLTTGDTNSGYYSTPDGGATYQANALSHDAYAELHGTTYFVPTEDEWYKAAYYDASGTNGYSLYADGNSNVNYPPVTGGGATGWNYSNVNAAPNYTRGTAQGTTEQNGTVNMMGNVEEWMEDAAGVGRGGRYNDTGANWLSTSGRFGYNPSDENPAIGFRTVVVVPQFIRIGDAGNSADTTGFGGVAYEYKISAQEVTIAEFAASGAGDGDENYWNDGARTVGTSAPAVNVSLYEAMKYCNWLTTGDTNNGYYSTPDFGATYQANALSHDAYVAAHGTTYFVPTEDEWYKAAYWMGSGYSLYADGTSNTNKPPVKGGGATGWNYNDVNDFPNYVRSVALGATEQNGTVNMMGNVREWMEVNTIRGGAFFDNEIQLRSSVRNSLLNPSWETQLFGFRPVVVVPRFIPIGDAGNADDATTGYGGVAYEYKISNREVTIAEFAASGAGDGDEDYWNDGTRTVGPNAPAVRVSLSEAMKYCNWLSTGDTNSGYYSHSGEGVYVANALSHDAYAELHGTTYFVPTEDEWYKAAYWTGNGYSLYADGTSDANHPPTEGGGASGWNYNNANAAPNYTRSTALGTPEQNGTVNMMGNVSEWMEDAAGVRRGGVYYDSENNLRSSYRVGGFGPSFEHSVIGFRTVEVVPPFIRIGDAGNAADMYGSGAVAYEYRISAREVSIAEMAASGAGDGNEDFWNDGTRTVGPNAPAVRVSLYDAMRYCNWLTTGDVNKGYYSTSDGGTTYQADALSHDAYAGLHGTTYFVPTKDEWYKAAYWTGSGYSLYADGTSDFNNPPAEGGGATGWNYNSVNADPNYTRATDLGTTEQNGTLNMMGNVVEWMEDSAGSYRGGGALNDEFYLRSTGGTGGGSPGNENGNIGFRPVVVIAVPTMATAPSLVMSGVDFSWQSELGWNYSVLTTTNLVTAPWSIVPGWPHSGTGGILIYTNTYTDSPRFFKVDVSAP